jgi:hypothetical protein
MPSNFATKIAQNNTNKKYAFNYYLRACKAEERESQGDDSGAGRGPHRQKSC